MLPYHGNPLASKKPQPIKQKAKPKQTKNLTKPTTDYIYLIKYFFK